MKKAKRIKTLEGYTKSLEERIEELEAKLKALDLNCREAFTRQDTRRRTLARTLEERIKEPELPACADSCEFYSGIWRPEHLREKDGVVTYDPTGDTPSKQKALWVELLSHVYDVHVYNTHACALCEDIRVAFAEAGKLIQTEFKK